jgi:N-acetyl-gamma-glutamyl-phosphate reductase
MTVLTASSPATATAGIAGSSGYAGRELHRLLASHPRLAAAACTADTRALAESDIVFLALPHGASGEIASELASARVPVVDLSADLRAEWQYGLPELHRVAIATSGAIANPVSPPPPPPPPPNPGCYATAALLALAPLAEAGAIESHVVVDGKSGVSGAGKKPTDANTFCAAAEGIAPYSPVGHHHQLEIEQQLSVLAGAPQTVTFTPHLAPFTRGLLVTAYGRMTAPITQAELDDLYLDRYLGEPFVSYADGVRTHSLRGTNLCQIKAWADPERGAVIVSAAIDNLVKGAAGQAIQNANLMLGFDEALGLPAEASWL